MIDPTEIDAAFRAHHGRRAARLFSAPGRVNLIGEHTDYNDGFVLPMAIDRGTVVAASPRSDRRITAWSTNLGDAIDFDLDGPGTPRRGTWQDYVEGVARTLEQRGHRLGGADLVLGSDVPSGAGLSSSAALELSVGLALTALAGHEVSGVDLALAGQAAEHAWVGTQCGIMDQFIAALGRADHALLIDCRSLESTLIPLELGGAVVVITDSKVKHELSTSAYNTRRAECARGVELLAARRPGIRALRDVSPAELAAGEALLPEPIRRRCRHVVSEIARTLAAAEALRGRDLASFGRLMDESHRSLRDDYEVSCVELDVLVEAAVAVPGVFGSRMTGGGFGGSTVSLVEGAAVERFTVEVGRRFEDRFGRRPDFFTSRACDGAREIEGRT
jgi:galactokinase